jgi:hypothetical protein
LIRELLEDYFNEFYEKVHYEIGNLEV